MKKSIILITLLLSILIACKQQTPKAVQEKQDGVPTVERWSVFEIELSGTKTGNPFKEVSLTATFIHQCDTIQVTGFYDGNGVYFIRFMPCKLGKWTYQTKSNTAELNDQSGSFICIAPEKNNHGPIDVFNTYHFRYADGTPYYQVGTTCYAWVHQGDSLEEKTLETLKNAPFNKLRMCVFPKDYAYNQNEPQYYIFPRNAQNENDYSRFNPEFFHHFEKRLIQLQEIGIEADIILFHPYDRWGYSQMPDSVDEFYLKYVIARLSAFRNVWWSVANEFDFMDTKSIDDWHRFFEIIYKSDPYKHLRSIHNGAEWYDHTNPWITHASLQTTAFENAAEWRKKFKKPLIFDECRYEGNIVQGWGNLKPQEMTAMFWRSLITGTYAGHGETYKHPRNILWWAKGGVLHGKSPERIAFFKKILEETPSTGFTSFSKHSAAKHGEQYIYYFDTLTPAQWTFHLPKNIKYKVEVIDTWQMSINNLGVTSDSVFTIKLPQKKYMAVQITKTEICFPLKPVETYPIGDIFYNQIDIELQHPDINLVYYTTDGTNPTKESTKYTKPVKITKQTVLKAIAIDGDKTSQITEIEYQPVELKPAIAPENLKQGLQYAYYEGKWTQMPNFDQIKPKKTGFTKDIELNLGDSVNYYGLVFKGYIKIPEDALYTFFTASDDGSFLIIDGEKVVYNDFQHGIKEEFGQIALAKGYHSIEIQFFDNWYDEFLEISIQSRKMPKQKINNQMFYCNFDMDR